MTARINHYTLEVVESFPTPMLPGVLYVSPAYSTAGHLCPCGCGGTVVTKLSPARYRVIFDGEVSLQPSVAASGLACNSHYFITRGNVDWHHKLDKAQAARAQTADRRAIELEREQRTVPETPRKPSLWDRFRRKIH